MIKFQDQTRDKLRSGTPLAFAVLEGGHRNTLGKKIYQLNSDLHDH